MLWVLIFVGIMQLVLMIAAILFYKNIKKLHHDFENHKHYSCLGE